MPLPKELDTLIAPILKALRVKLLADVNGHAVLAYIQGYVQMTQWAGLPYEGPPIQRAIDYARDHCATLVTGMDDETKTRLADIISKGIENKRGVPGLSRDIRDEFTDMTKNRSDLIATTETNDALEQAFMDRAKELGIEGKEWITAEDEVVCPICGDNGDEGIVLLDHVYEFGSPKPPAHPGCLLPNVRVEASHIIAGSRASYRGKAIEIRTENGNILSCTSNHPILTPFGFVKAQYLHEGNYIIRSLDSEGIFSGIDPNENHRPSFIEDIWNSLVVKKGMLLCSMPVSPEDFYGDARGFDSDVDIVYPDSFLSSDIRYSTLFEHGSHNKLNRGNTDLFSFPRLSPEFSLSDSMVATSCHKVRSSSPSFSLFCGHSAHRNDIGLATITRDNARFEQSPADSSPIYTELSGQFQFRFASLIAPEQIVKVRYFNYSGHVYDLQSLEQLYIGNGIVVKNCRCALAPARLEK